MKKQIEKMASICINACIKEENCIGKCEKCHAQTLYNAGYRKQEWISVNERLPEPEKEVLILAVRKNPKYGDYTIITTAMYENGKVTTEESDWSWYDLDFVYDEENDCCYIPEDWWEYRHYNQYDVYNCAVEDKVTHWMPLPEPPKGE